jgi:hypothetical protein
MNTRPAFTAFDRAQTKLSDVRRIERSGSRFEPEAAGTA